ncbi:acetylornithine deacetylase [Martelella soudanensis]|uniref:acetylornithine deacetylase n=1 Tax=unclassified Martelella TaxID=2629616 RepID=UPI0015DD96A2|nr:MULTISPECIES: acetylornithine deacetylase [unclassified Martelella]
MCPAFPGVADNALLEHLDRLIAFNTVSARSNLAIIGWIEHYCRNHGGRTRRFENEGGDKANLLVSFGPDRPGGIVLSAHTDVVPTEGQAWRGDPFRMRRGNGRLIGRGTADMKGFIACCLAAVPEVSQMALERPLHLAFSHDEETGCNGVRPMVDWIAGSGLAPRLAIIGEPSSMQVVNAHKGCLITRVRVSGKPGHSSKPEICVNAVTVAARLITEIEHRHVALRDGPRFERLDPPQSTTQVNRIVGGNALNIVAEDCEFLWEARFIPGENDQVLLDDIRAFAAAELEPAMKAVEASCGIDFSIEAHVPALEPNADPALERDVMALLGQSEADAVSYGSEAGIFQRAGIPAIICGPGDMADAHRAEEYVTEAELRTCVDFLGSLIGKMNISPQLTASRF